MEKDTNQSNGLLSNIFDKRVLNKYTKLLPEKHNIYYYFEIEEDNCGFIFYIAEEMQDLPKLNNDLIVGYVSGFISTDKVELNQEDMDDIMENCVEKLDRTPYKKNVLKVLGGKGKGITLIPEEQQLLIEVQTRFIAEDLTISFVSVNEPYLGKGVGQFLMLLACDFAKHTYGIKKISLDDDSDNAWNLERNLYIRLGLWYINENNSPEMEGLLDIILKKFKAIKEYYTDKTRKSYDGSPFMPYFI